MSIKLPEVLSEKNKKRFEKLSTTLISDAMGRSGSMEYNIAPVASGVKLIGTAITVNTAPGDNLFIHQAIYSGKKGYVLVVDGGGDQKNAYIGELMTKAAKAVGIEGIVIDGLVRDQEALKYLKYPVFSKGFTPNGPFKEGPGEINKFITCGGISVAPGDILMGDNDGVVVVPKNKIEKILDKAEEKLTYEKERVKQLEDYENNKINSIEPSWLKEKISLYKSNEI